MNTIDRLILNETIDVTMAAGVISYEGCAEINNFMRKLGIPRLPDWWDWHTRVGGKGEYVGSFPKRVAKYYYQTIQYKMSSDNLGALGGIMAQHTNRDNRYRFDFTDCFDWDAGDFGDSGSCFWTDNEGAREALQDYGAYAIRFYDDDDTGYARAWVCRENDCYVVFNGYGLETAHIARIMSDYLGLSYRKVTLDNYGETGGLIWINGGAGYVVGSESSVNGLSRVSLEIEGGTTCNDCHCLVNEDDCYSLYNGNVVCDECFCDNYFSCEDCHEYYPNDDCCGVAGDVYVCGSCLSANYTECEDCNEYHSDNDILSIDDKDICRSCFEDGEYYTCDDCGEIHHESICLMFDGNCICEDCIESYTCSSCEKHYSDMDRVHGKLVCTDCIDEVEVVAYPLLVGAK